MACDRDKAVHVSNTTEVQGAHIVVQDERIKKLGFSTYCDKNMMD